MRCYDFLPPFRRALFPSLGDTIMRPLFVPPGPDAEPWINLEFVGGISSRRSMETTGSPSSRGTLVILALSSDPGVTGS